MLHTLWRRLIRFGFRLLYNELAWSYDAVSWLASRGAWRAWQRAALPYVAGPDVLEIGHGPGHMLVALRRAGVRVVGLEPSPFMVRQARRRLARAALAVPLARGRAPALPFAPASFDTVLATFPTGYVVEMETLTAVSRALKPNGRFIIVPAAQLEGRGPLTRFIAWLYHITGQRSDAFAQDADGCWPERARWDALEARFITAGFAALHVHTLPLDRSRVTVLAAYKAPAAAEPSATREPQVSPARARLTHTGGGGRNDNGMNEFESHDDVHDAQDANAPSPREHKPAAGWERALLYAVLAIILATDQATKYLIETNLAMFDFWVPFPSIGAYFRIYHTFNTGASFGLFPNGGFFFAVMAVIVSLAIFYYNHTLAGGQRLLRLALGLQAGGALGNFVDRVRLGHVTDFLDFNLQPLINVPLADWPVFNVADTAIVGGVILLAGIMLREELRLRAAHPNQSAAPRPSPSSGPHVDNRSAS